MGKPRSVHVLLFDGVNAVDVAGPLEAFASVASPDGARAYEPRVWSIGARQIRSESGLRLCADGPAPARTRGDLLLVPGGVGVREPQTLGRLAAWLRRNHSGFTRIAAVCTGAYALAESGLVDSRTIATHWAHARDLQRRYPRVRVDADALFLKDGRFYSSGGVTAGIDLALELIEADCGARAAMDVARELVVFLRRTGAQAQFSEPLKLQAAAPGRLKDVCSWAASHLSGDLSVEGLARRAGLSTRQFSRLFREAFGAAPASYVKTLRLDAARTLLAQGGAVARVAEATGFKSADVFRRAFERQFHVSPSEYRNRFGRKRSKV
jgi:transcriptional regulator GlxA family with amidase domain